MLKALYDFKASLPKTLSFHEGELFVLLQSNVKQKNWWQVVNANGQVGYIPYNYVKSIEVTPQFLKDFIDKCLQNVDHETEINDREKEVGQGNEKVINSESGPGEKKEVARKLRERLEALVIDGDGDHSSKKKKAPAPPPPRSPLSCLTQKRPSSTSSLTVSSAEEGNCNSGVSTGHKDTEELGEAINNIRQDRECQSVSDILHGVDLPKITYRLVEEVRHQTHLSHNLSKVAVQVVVEELERQQTLIQESVASSHTSPPVPSSLLSAVLDLLLTPPPADIANFTTTQEQTTDSGTPSRSVSNSCPETDSSDKSTSTDVWWGLRPDLLSESHDGRRLRQLLRELAAVREDEQQRSWAVHEDEIPIIQCVSELISILEDADANVCRLIVCEGGLSRISSLIEYFQMETRWSIRRLLLQAFSLMCDLHRTPTIVMLNSVLPMELARDMKSNPTDVARLKQSALLLTRIFSIGEAMPIYHYEHLGEDFISFLIDRLEEEVDLDSESGKEEHEIPDLFLTLLLAYNLQFKEQSLLPSTDEGIPEKSMGNPVLNVLKNRTCAKALTEKALLLINREVDPVGVFPSARHTVKTHSVLKLVGDLFGDAHTAALFYTNDIKVLIDILVRQLSDLSPGDQRRGQWLWLCRRVIRNCGYGEHLHRRDDLSRCFTRIFCEDTASSSSDQHLVRDIINEFPMFFKV